jgi:DNA-binding NtrC family response regulator
LQPSDSNKRLKILMFEGDKALTQRYHVAFQKWPIAPEVVIVSNAREGLAAFDHEPVDMVIADIDTVGLDSLEMAVSFKQRPGHGEVCVVLVGGLTQNIVTLSNPLPLGKLLNTARETLKRKVAKLDVLDGPAKRLRA